MAMDFADDNAKILYVGHLIDQALTRPDVLALYYASSHGRANNCRIKTEIKQNGGVDSNDLPPETPNPMDIEHISSSNSASPNHHHRNKRKRRNHNKHKKHSNSNTHSVFSNGHTPLNMHNTHNTHRVKQEPLISAPQPATISLSGGNPMNFVNGVSFPPLNIPPHGAHLSGIPPNLPPINIPFPMHDNRGNVSHNKMPQIPLNIAQSIQHNHHHNMNGDRHTHTQPPPPSSNNNEATNDSNNGNTIFPINVTPSVMMGGPPLASM
eukprot:460686_1